MVFGQKLPFLQLLFFLGKIRQENVFNGILQRENAFLGHKNKKFKKSKNCHYSKGVDPWFLYKNGHLSNSFFLRQYRPGKCLLRYSRTKKRLSRPKKTQKFQKVDLLTFFQNPWFWSKNGHFFKFFFLGNIGQENAFLGYKNKKFKK